MSQNDVKLGAVKNSAFLANVSYDSTDKMKTSDFAKVENDKITLTNPATNSSFEVFNQKNNDIQLYFKKYIKKFFISF